MITSRLFALFLGYASCFGMAAQSGGEDEQIGLWVTQHYRDALNVLLPVRAEPLRPFPREALWIVDVRIVPAFGTEFQISLTRFYSGGIEAMFAFPEGGTIREQMSSIRNQKPEGSLEELVREVTIRRSTVTTQECPELASLTEKLETSVGPTIPEQTLWVDATQYEFAIQTMSNHVRLSLSGPGTQGARGLHPLVSWAEDVHSVLKGFCSGVR